MVSADLRGLHVVLLPLWPTQTILAFATNVYKVLTFGTRGHPLEPLEIMCKFVIVHLYYFSGEKENFFMEINSRFSKESKSLRNSGRERSWYSWCVSNRAGMVRKTADYGPRLPAFLSQTCPLQAAETFSFLVCEMGMTWDLFHRLLWGVSE